MRTQAVPKARPNPVTGYLAGTRQCFTQTQTHTHTHTLWAASTHKQTARSAQSESAAQCGVTQDQHCWSSFDPGGKTADKTTLRGRGQRTCRRSRPL